MANQLTFRSGSGINLTANTTESSITIATEGTLPSTTAPLAVDMGGLGRTDMANQIATAAEEQSHVTGEITTNVTAIKDVADEIASGAIQAEDDAHKLQRQADDLNGKVAHFIL